MSNKRNMLGIGMAIVLVIFTVINFFISSKYIEKSLSKNDAALITQSSISVEPISNSSIVYSDLIISFIEYQTFYEYLLKDFKLKGYELKYGTKHDFINIIEPDWAFNTRDRLLLPDDGRIPMPTFEYMIFENKENTSQIRISVCFNEYYIGNNLHSFFLTDSDLREINGKLARKAVGAVMSYQNLLFHIQVSNTDKGNNALGNTLTELSSMTTKYFEHNNVK